MAFCAGCGSPTGAFDVHCSSCGAAVRQEAQAGDAVATWGRAAQPSRTHTPETIGEAWRRSLLLGAFGAGGALLAAISLALRPTVGAFVALAAAGSIVASAVWWWIFLYRLWDQAQSFTNRARPGQAVGFLFIPFFNLYWNFVAYHHLAKAMNGHMARGGFNPQLRINEGLVLAACILQIAVVFLPWWSPLTGLAWLICCVIIAFQLRNAGQAIAEQASQLPY